MKGAGNIFAMIFFVALFAGAVHADETLKFRTVMHSLNAQTIDVGDVDGHILGVARFSGIVSLPDGSTATSYFTGAFEYTKGAGPVSTYMNVTYEDGSALWLKTMGTAAVDGTKTVFQGDVECSRGKGQVRWGDRRRFFQRSAHGAPRRGSGSVSRFNSKREKVIPL